MDDYSILLVDDDVLNLDLLESILTTYLNIKQITKVDQSTNAFEIAKQLQPSLIITDWEMPQKNGIELIIDLKLDEITAEIPIIIATGIMTDSEHIKTALDAGAIDFIRKPIDRIELIARVNSVLKISAYQKLIVVNKNKDIALHLLYLLQKNDFEAKMLKNLKDLHEKVINNATDSIELLEEVIENLNTEINNQLWNDFEVYFNQFHPDFTKKLLSKYSNLSPAEIKLCTYLRLNMDTKTIALVTHRSEDSVKMSRKRLRKQLGLQQSDNLVAVLSAI